MKYVKNNLTYSVTIKGHVFDCLRHYSDTGNLYSSGVTAIEDKEFAELKKIKVFEKMLGDRELELTSKEEMTGAANAFEEVSAENEKLTAENEELKKSLANGATKEELDAALAENKKLKATLEALAKKDGADAKKGTNEKADNTEGF